MLACIQNNSAIHQVLDKLEDSSNNVTEKELKIIHLTKKIKESIGQIGIFDTFDVVMEDIFELRMYLLANPQHLDTVPTSLNKAIQKQYSTPTKFAKLEHVYVLALDLGAKVSEQVIETSKSYGKKIILPNYKDFTSSLNIMHQSDILSACISLSLEIEYLLMVSKMVLDNHLIVSKKNIEELEVEIKLIAEDYGVFCHQVGFWTPRINDESSLLRNIKIRLGYIEAISNKPMKSIDIDTIERKILS